MRIDVATAIPAAAAGGSDPTAKASVFQEDADAEFNLPPAFAAWLRQALAKELDGADADCMFTAAEVILAHPEELSDALAEVQELCRDQNAPQTANELLQQWHKACTG